MQASSIITNSPSEIQQFKMCLKIYINMNPTYYSQGYSCEKQSNSIDGSPPWFLEQLCTQANR